MSSFCQLRSAFITHLGALAMIVGLLFSAQSIAWQKAGYSPYYSPTGYYSPYIAYPRTAYYQPVYPGYYNSPSQSYSPAKIQPEKETEKEVSTRLKDSDNTHLKARKQAFLDTLLPYIQKENARLRELRARLIHLDKALDSQQAISQKSKQWLQRQAKTYRVSGNPVTETQTRVELIQKIDIIPASLTLAQAANESAWGKSRFATEANNLFGIWTYDKNKGIKPRNRETDKKHLVRKFDNPGESVSFYMATLNTHPAYQKLRDIRYRARVNQQLPNGLKMAAGLEKYSARGKQYIQLIQRLIRQNKWANLDEDRQQV